MAETPRQLPLVLPHDAALGLDDYLVGTPNRAAYELLEAWPDWPSPVVVLAGPAGSGKSHFVAALSELTGAVSIGADELTSENVEALAATPALVLENAHLGFDNIALFHLLNAARQNGKVVLITSRSLPSSWHVTLPDLASRLRAAAPVLIEEPDDDLLGRVLVKLFADRQISVDQSVVDYLTLRMERSLDNAQKIVDAIDRESLADRRKITKQLAGKVLENVDNQRQ